MAKAQGTVVDLSTLPQGAELIIRVDGAEMTLPLQARSFKSGSVGYYGQTKVPGADGRRYQVGFTATLIGSKPQA